MIIRASIITGTFLLIGLIAATRFSGAGLHYAAGDTGVTVVTEAAEYRTDADLKSGIDGVDTSEQVAERPGQVPTLAGESGVGLASRFADPNLVAQSDIAGDMRLIEDIRALLSINVRQAVIDADDPRLRLQEIEKSITETIDSTIERLRDLNSSSQQLQQTVTSLEERSSSLEDEYFTAIDALDADRSAELLDQFVDVNTRLVQAKAESGKVNAVRRRLRESGRSLRNRQTAIVRNREALVAGVRVDPQTARQLGLLKSPEDLESEAAEAGE